MVVDRRAGGLHDKHIGTPTDSWMETAISPSLKVVTSDFPTGRPRFPRDLAGQGRVGIGGKDLDILPMKIHN